jgi:hypothetical protein
VLAATWNATVCCSVISSGHRARRHLSGLESRRRAQSPAAGLLPPAPCYLDQLKFLAPDQVASAHVVRDGREPRSLPLSMSPSVSGFGLSSKP